MSYLRYNVRGGVGGKVGRSDSDNDKEGKFRVFGLKINLKVHVGGLLVVRERERERG